MTSKFIPHSISIQNPQYSIACIYIFNSYDSYNGELNLCFEFGLKEPLKNNKNGATYSFYCTVKCNGNLKIKAYKDIEYVFKTALAKLKNSDEYHKPHWKKKWQNLIDLTQNVNIYKYISAKDIMMLNNDFSL